ncbi:MAG: DUF899 domain-containing protein [Thermomicrobiales bacterium]
MTETTTTTRVSALPPIVSREAWTAARADLLAKEKALMRAGDALAAERRRLPMVEVTQDYTFGTPEGPRSLRDLFDGRNQLIVYHFMFGPDWDAGCDGCSMFVDNLDHPAHLNARDVSRVLISRAPLPKLEAYKARMGWTEPWISSFGTSFNEDFGATVNGEEHHRLSVFLRDDATGRVFLTYQTQDRGAEMLMNTFHFLDLVPYGRQEEGDDAPEGWPQGPRYAWWKRHDEYATHGTPAPSRDGRDGASGGGCPHCH